MTIPGRYRLFSDEKGTLFFEGDFGKEEMAEKYAKKRGFKKYRIIDIFQQAEEGGR